jgi:hypothetical protein
VNGTNGVAPTSFFSSSSTPNYRFLVRAQQLRKRICDTHDHLSRRSVVKADDPHNATFSHSLKPVLSVDEWITRRRRSAVARRRLNRQPHRSPWRLAK